jgi:hypothetical protein
MQEYIKKAAELFQLQLSAAGPSRRYIKCLAFILGFFSFISLKMIIVSLLEYMKDFVRLDDLHYAGRHGMQI